MPFKEIISIHSEIYTKQISTHCGENAELLKLKQVVRIVTIALEICEKYGGPTLKGPRS
jgi:hypothetical protein